MDDFRRVAHGATRDLEASEEKDSERSLCAEPHSLWRCVTLAVLMVCFVAATPLSLALTLPAYILADRVRASALLSYCACMYGCSIGLEPKTKWANRGNLALA